jgi:hypothetical protein
MTTHHLPGALNTAWESYDARFYAPLERNNFTNLFNCSRYVIDAITCLLFTNIRRIAVTSP